MLTAIRQWVLKTMMKDQTGIVKTLPKRDLVEFNVQMTAERLARNGVNPQDLKNVNQVENAINQIEAPRNVNTGIRQTESAKVIDMEGKEIPPGSKIMGGKATETEAEVLARMNKENKESVARIKNKNIVKDAIDNASPGFVKGDRKYNAQLVADDLAEKKFGKDFYDLDQKQQMDLYGEALDGLDNSDKFAQGGRAGFKAGSGKGILQFFKNLVKPKPKPKFDVERFREGPIDLKFLENIDKKDLAPFIRSRDTMGPGGYGMYDNFADMPAGLRAAELIKTIKGPRNEINYKAAELFLGKKLKGNESADELIQILNRQEMRADGGRIGLKAGMTKRAFLKLMGTGAAGIAALKSGLLGFGKGAGKQVAEEVVKKSTSTPPAYFFELANKIKTLGRVTDGPQERLKVHTMPAKDGKSELMLTEDLGTGEMQIKKIGKENDEMISEVQTMEYTPGSSMADETTKGIPADDYQEYTEVQSRIYKDEFNDPDIVEGINVEDIVKEVKDQTPSIKKADGGIAMMLGE